MLNSRRKLKPKDAERFAHAEPALFRELARIVCNTGILPEKELHECWQMAQLVHKEFPKALHIADIAAGHGLLAWILVLMARTAEAPIPRTAVAVDITRPKSADTLAEALKKNWPDLEDSVPFVEGSIDAVRAVNGPKTLFVANHACGSLSDRVLIAAIKSGSSVAIMPCCHSLRKQKETLSLIGRMSGLSADGVLPNPDSIDQFRKQALSELDYLLSEQSISPEVTAFHRIIFGKAPLSPSPKLALPSAQEFAPVKRLGEIRAYEKVAILDVSDLAAAQLLSKRPSREWRRVFDLSFWIDDEAEGERLREELQAFTAKLEYTANVKILGQFKNPETQQHSMTFRIEMLSSTIPITKELALSLRSDIWKAVDGRFRLRT